MALFHLKYFLKKFVCEIPMFWMGIIQDFACFLFTIMKHTWQFDQNILIFIWHSMQIYIICQPFPSYMYIFTFNNHTLKFYLLSILSLQLCQEDDVRLFTFLMPDIYNNVSRLITIFTNGLYLEYTINILFLHTKSNLGTMVKTFLLSVIVNS